jgi:hypothetical protein
MVVRLTYAGVPWYSERFPNRADYLAFVRSYHVFLTVRERLLWLKTRPNGDVLWEDIALSMLDFEKERRP